VGEVLLEFRGGIAVVTLNRPERLNALSAAMHEELKAAWGDVKGHEGLGAVVVTGSGRGFCVGMDLHQTAERGQFRTHKSDRIADIQTMTALNNDVWLPTIVAVNGVCAGGGLHFVADADVVLASEDATFVDPHVTVGQVSALEPISLVARIGLGKALRLAVLGRSGGIDAHEAHRIGLVDEVLAPEELFPRALEVAEAATKGSPAAIEGTKRAIWASLGLALGDALQGGWETIVAHREHPDALEGPRAFAAKVDPKWTTSRSQSASEGKE